jgi:hypothetical protein
LPVIPKREGVTFLKCVLEQKPSPTRLATALLSSSHAGKKRNKKSTTSSLIVEEVVLFIGSFQLVPSLSLFKNDSAISSLRII